MLYDFQIHYVVFHVTTHIAAFLSKLFLFLTEISMLEILIRCISTQHQRKIGAYNITGRKKEINTAMR